MKQHIKSVIEHIASRCGPHRFSDDTPRLWILMYHRILPENDPRFAQEEPGMIVTPASFHQHLKELKQLFELLPLSEWIERRNGGTSLPKRACAITFDDGWLDNYEFALPILQQEHVPATLFAVSDMIGTHTQFWPNRVARLISKRPDWRRQNALDWIPRASGDFANNTYSLDQSVSSEQLASIIVQLKKISDAELKQRLDESERQLGLTPVDSPALVDWDQLRAMQNSGLVEIGSHTCNHFRLTADLSSDVAEQEIVQSKRMLEQQLDRPVNLFCYPNGDSTSHAVDLVARHYTAAVTTQRGINTANTAPHQLLRVGMHEHVSDTPAKFQARLSNWI